MKFKKLAILVLVSITLTFCSSKSDKELFEEASSLISKDQNTEAINLLEGLINDNPKSEYVPGAHFEIAKAYIAQGKYDDAVNEFNEVINKYSENELVKDALFENAKLYQGQVIKSINAAESTQKAVEIYKQIFEKFPSSDKAESSLFMAGFLQANELNDFDAARSTYELFLMKYPDGDLADDASVELENLGKTPEEILQEKID